MLGWSHAGIAGGIAGGNKKMPAYLSEEDARVEDNSDARCAIAPKHVVLFQKIYDAAQRVAANPDNQLASNAARRLIAAFHGDVYRDETWLRSVSPSGTA